MRHNLLLFLLTISFGPRFVLAAEKMLDFNRDIRPILSENCFQCHGFDEKARQAELRLDIADSAYAKLDDDTVPIVPGHPEKSELWRRVTSDDESEQMPPPDSHHRLKTAQKAKLKLWIEQGAPYEKQWAFIPPKKAPLPEVSDKSWPRNEIDNFILARLDAEGLTHAPEADRRTLIRRLYFDLTGLPPNAAEVEAFAADDTPNAYEHHVDRLLASPHFGERMALVWLDAARYADTNGYSIDGGRHMWLWRDWVINAFNTNLPYDEFLREQLAGDLLPHHTEAQLIATGFQRNNMNTHEGGTIPAENLTNYNVDRVKTFGESILGLTLGCCQCHDHKFDPLTQKDYYQIFAYFNTLSDAGLDGDRGINSRPSIDAKTVLQTGEEPTLRKQIAALKQKLSHPSDAEVEQWIAEQRLWLSSRGKDLKFHPVELLKVSTPNTGAGFDIVPPRFVHISSPAALVAYDVSIHLPKLDKPITGLRVVFHPDPAAPNGGWGYGTLPAKSTSTPPPTAESLQRPAEPGNVQSKKGTFVLSAFSASADPVPGDQVNLNRLREVEKVTADSWLSDWRPENVLDTRNKNGWSPAAAHDGPTHLTVTFAKPIDTATTPYMTVQLNFGHGDQLVAAKFEIQAMTGADDGSDLPPEIVSIIEPTASPTIAGGPKAPGSAGGSPEVDSPRLLALPSGATGSANAFANLSSDQQQTLRAYYADHANATKRDRIALANLAERLDVLTKQFPTMVMDVAEKPRETHILNRGDYSQPKEKVNPGTPAILPPPPAGAQPTVSASPTGLRCARTRSQPASK